MPPFDQALVGKWIEILWPYTVKDGAEKGEKKLIWATGRVVRIADGITDKRSKRAQKLLPAGGAVLVHCLAGRSRSASIVAASFSRSSGSSHPVIWRRPFSATFGTQVDSGRRLLGRP